MDEKGITNIDSKVEKNSIRTYTHKIKRPLRDIVGREKEMDMVLAAMCRPEYCNVILLAEAGTGKTALVQGLMIKDQSREYIEVDLSKMISDLPDPNEMAPRLKALFDDIEHLHNECGKEIVVFMDEFHQIVQLSAASVEALKPLLADSGTRGIKVIAATTLLEFDKFIAPNQPLVERLQRINLPEPNKKMTVEILRGFAQKNGVANQFYNDKMYEMIYEYTNRYKPSSAQPRKSILVLDDMIGWNKATGEKIDRHLLAKVIYNSEGINVAFNVDAKKIRESLDNAVYAQRGATKLINDWLQVAVCGLNDRSKPMASFLFCGSTGVGKTEMTKQLVSLMFGRDRADGDENQSSNKHFIRFDMSEYALETSQERFREELAQRIWERPHSVVLLDEIEKAHPSITRILLQVLDDGRLTDKHNRQVVFTNCYIVLTTNAGSEVYKNIAQYCPSDTGDIDNMDEFMKNIRTSLSQGQGNRFPPELLGRVTAIIPFQPLSLNTKLKIVNHKLEALKKKVMEEHSVKVIFDEELAEYLVRDKMDSESDSGGARDAVNRLDTEVTVPLATFINDNPDVNVVKVIVTGETAYKNKNMRISKAHVEVYEVRMMNRII